MARYMDDCYEQGTRFPIPFREQILRGSVSCLHAECGNLSTSSCGLKTVSCGTPARSGRVR